MEKPCHIHHKRMVGHVDVNAYAPQGDLSEWTGPSILYNYILIPMKALEKEIIN